MNPDKAGIIAPPPVIYLGFLGVGFLLHWKLPVKLVPGFVAPLLGWPIIMCGGLVLFLAIRTMHCAHTPVNPYKAATAIVTDGPYRFTRNPIYIAEALIYLGIASLISALWPAFVGRSGADPSSADAGGSGERI